VDAVAGAKVNVAIRHDDGGRGVGAAIEYALGDDLRTPVLAGDGDVVRLDDVRGEDEQGADALGHVELGLHLEGSDIALPACDFKGPCAGEVLVQGVEEVVVLLPACHGRVGDDELVGAGQGHAELIVAIGHVGAGTNLAVQLGEHADGLRVGVADVEALHQHRQVLAVVHNQMPPGVEEGHAGRGVVADDDGFGQALDGVGSGVPCVHVTLDGKSDAGHTSIGVCTRSLKSTAQRSFRHRSGGV
jgi:hypothetical protein